YIDNKMVGSCVYCNVKPSTYPLMVGAHHNNFYNLKGNVDELKVYDLAISKETLKKLSREAYVQPLNKLTDQTVAPEGTITLDAGSGFDSYIWSDGKNQQMNTLSNINSDITDLSVLAINEDGCYSDTISIFVSTSSVSHNDFKPEIKMWPCPVQNELYISFDQVPASKIEVYNLGGQLVFASVDLHATNVFSLKNLDNGPFVIKFYFDDIVVSEKIIKY
ncbi:MAG: T9SS type A sorting domain-containing protein, partial [Bacteroidota bacterium]